MNLNSLFPLGSVRWIGRNDAQGWPDGEWRVVAQLHVLRVWLANVSKFWFEFALAHNREGVRAALEV